MTDWGGERWIKIFKHEAGPWEMLSFAARGAYRLMQSEASAAGEIAVGRHGSGWLAIRFRIEPAVAAEILRELVADGYLRLNGGQWVLPHHAAQQVSRTTPAERQRQTRAAHKSAKLLEAPPDVTRSDSESHVVTSSHEREKEREKETNKAREQEQSAGAREAAAPLVSIERDPRAAEIATALAASSRFSRLGGDVAEQLLGHLGPLALQLDAGKVASAIAAAALELEEGATERRQRQVLGWKFKDALEPQKARANGKGKHFVQGDPNMKQFIKNVSAGRPSWDNGDGTP